MTRSPSSRGPLAGILLAAALTLPAAAQSPDAFVVDYLSGNLIRFPLDTPANKTLIGFYAKFVDGLEFGSGGVLYGLRNTGDLDAVDPTDASSTRIGTISPLPGHIWTGLAYDATTDTMYASSTNASNASSLYTVDTSAGTAALVGSTNVAESIVDIAVDASGVMYGLDLVGNQLHRIDKSTGEATLIGPTGYIGTGPWHGMDFRASTGELFLASHNGINNDNELRSANLSTGATTVLGSVTVAVGSLAIAAEPGPTIYCTAKTSSAGCVTAISTSNPSAQPLSGASDYSVTASTVQGGKNGLLFAGISGPSNLPFSGGILCVNPPNKRGPVMNSGGSNPAACDGAFSQLVNDGTIIPAGLDPGSGNTAWYQWWYRDPNNGAGTLGTALSDAAQVDFF